jgi:hypothetical protein
MAGITGWSSYLVDLVKVVPGSAEIVDQCWKPSYTLSKVVLLDIRKDMGMIGSILWQGFVLPGHDACRLFSRDAGWQLEESALFSHPHSWSFFFLPVVSNE